MPRIHVPISVSLHLPNPAQSQPYASPLSINQVTVATREDGAPAGQAVQYTFPLSPEDITDEMLSAMDVQLRAVGLTLAREPAAPPAPLVQAFNAPAPAPASEPAA